MRVLSFPIVRLRSLIIGKTAGSFFGVSFRLAVAKGSHTECNTRCIYAMRYSWDGRAQAEQVCHSATIALLNPMKTANQIVFRRVTDAEFFHINKPPDTEEGGGGQSYIDFPMTTVRPKDWVKFFAGQKKEGSHGRPFWNIPVNSLGLGMPQTAKIGQRRDASYAIRAQKLLSKKSNRLYSWHPTYTGFPVPKDPSVHEAISNLVVYLIRAEEGDYWAGWFQTAKPKTEWEVETRLAPLFNAEDGYIYLDPGVKFDENDLGWPFRAAVGSSSSTSVAAIALPAKVSAQVLKKATLKGASKSPAKLPSAYSSKTEQQIMDDLLSEDFVDAQAAKKQVVVSVLERNQRMVAALKALYGGECQLTGTEHAFKKANGDIYCEAHHLIPLGVGGADSPYNLIIVSPLVHRMLHYAVVSEIDLSKISDNKLHITINDEPFTITWDPKHFKLIERYVKKSDFGQK